MAGFSGLETALIAAVLIIMTVIPVGISAWVWWRARQRRTG